MNAIDNYFKEKTKEIGFLELKDDVYIGRDKYITKDIPLPIVTNKLIKKIKSEEINEELDLQNIIEGIIYIIGSDQDFPYLGEYKEILLKYNPNIIHYLLHNAAKNLQEGLWDVAGLWLRTLLSIDNSNIEGLFNYGLVLEELGRNFIVKGIEEVGGEFINSSTNLFETILDIDENYALSYYKLGFHYKHLEKYLKANLIWNKFLLLSSDDILTQEVRDEIESIKDDAYFETALSYLNYNDHEKALEALLKLLPKHKESWNVNFLIGQSYSAKGQYDRAIDYMLKALDLNEEISEIYNELGIAYFNLGNINEAIDIFSKGIVKNSGDFKLYFNRGLGYVESGLYELGLIDIEKAEELNPDDDNVTIQKEIIMQLLN